MTISGNCLAKNYEEVLALVKEILLEPRWDEAEFDRIKSAALNSIQQSNANPNAIASKVFNKVLYGEDHIFANPVTGTTETVANISLQDLKDYYNQNFSPSIASFHFVGALDKATVTASLSQFADWKAKEVDFPEYEIKTADEGSRIYFVDYPDAKQSVINIGTISMNGDDEAYAAANMANYRLGSGSGSILFSRLRLEKGYTYGAYSSFDRRMNGTPFTAASSVRSNVTRESVDLFKDILDHYGANFSEEDMEVTKNSILRSNTQSFETLGGLVGILQNISTYDLPTDYIKQNEEVLKSMDVAEAQRLIKEYMDPDKLIYVVVGDGKTQLNRLNGTGLGKPILVNKDDQSLKIQK
jgi:zinc protease